MTGPTKIRNQSSNTSKQTAVLNDDPTITPIQHLVNSVRWIKKREASSSKKSSVFGGIVLSASDMSIANFKKKFPEESSFYKSVVQKSGKVITPKRDASIIKAHCYIPEVSGILPFPDYETVNTYLSLYNGSNEPVKMEEQSNEEFEKIYTDYSNKRKDSMQKIYPSLYKEFQKIIMHPIFYKYVESSAPPSVWQYVDVVYTEDFDSLHTGVLKGFHGDFYRG